MGSFDLLLPLAEKARSSKGWLNVLNLLLSRVIPFNRPHGFGIEFISADKVRTKCTYKKANFNHIRGIHACAIATIAEFSAGFLLLTRLDPAKYRLIMSDLSVDYHYQAKDDIFSESIITSEQYEKDIIIPLQGSESVTLTMQSRVYDIKKNDIALAHTTWQVKRWDKVKTKV